MEVSSLLDIKKHGYKATGGLFEQELLLNLEQYQTAPKLPILFVAACQAYPERHVRDIESVLCVQARGNSFYSYLNLKSRMQLVFNLWGWEWCAVCPRRSKAAIPSWNPACCLALWALFAMGVVRNLFRAFRALKPEFI